MIYNKRKQREAINSANYNALRGPRRVRIIDFFPEEQPPRVTVETFDEYGNSEGVLATALNGPVKFVLDYRADEIAQKAPEPGDYANLYYKGRNRYVGFVRLAPGPASDNTFSYVPVRGWWAV